MRQLLAKGNTVLATARKPAAAADLQRLREAHADKLLISELDVASPQSIERFAAEAKARLAHVDVSSGARAGSSRGGGWPGWDRRLLPQAPARPPAVDCRARGILCMTLPRTGPPLGTQLLVNNAGVTDGWKGLDEVTHEDMLNCFVPNAIGAPWGGAGG